MAEKRATSYERTVLFVIAAGFLAWSAVFIFRSSFVGIDGNRYFSLFDDAMISMRFGWNLAHGLGLVWNPGEHVEGYSNLLMTLVMAASTLIFDKARAVLSIQILGAVVMLGNAFLTMRIVDYVSPGSSRGDKSLLRVLSFISVLAYYPLDYWSLMGMETGLLALMLLLGVLQALRYLAEPRSSTWMLMAVSLGLAFLTRNESALFAALVLVFVLWQKYRSRPTGKGLVPTLGPIAGAAGLFGLFVAGQLAFRYLYYGEFLPNTYVLKLTGMSLSDRIADGWAFVTLYLRETAPWLAVALFGLVLNFNWTKLLLGALVLTGIAYQVSVGGDPWLYWRMIAPVMPFLVVLVSQAILDLVRLVFGSKSFQDRLHRYDAAGRIAATVAVALVLLGIGFVDNRFRPEILFRARPYEEAQNEQNVNTAIALAQVTTKDATIGVFWAGSIPYYTGRVAIDFLGKSDKHIAQLAPDISDHPIWNGLRTIPGHNKFDLDYSIRTLRPTYAQGFAWGDDNISDWGKSAYTQGNYRGVSLYLLKDSPAVSWDRLSTQAAR